MSIHTNACVNQEGHLIWLKFLQFLENIFYRLEIAISESSNRCVCGLWAEGKEALAIYDFQARTSRELSFRKGDVLFLFEKVSADWWEGATAGNQKGLIPDKYIIARHRCVSYFIVIVMVDVDDSSLQVNSQPKSVGLATTWRCSTFIRWTRWNLAMTCVMMKAP